jgi:hypothetical protein
MAIYWIGIAGKPTPDQEERLAAAGLPNKGICGEAFSSTIYDTYYLSEAEDEDAAVERVADALPELHEEWRDSPPRVIRVGGSD